MVAARVAARARRGYPPQGFAGHASGATDRADRTLGPARRTDCLTGRSFTTLDTRHGSPVLFHFLVPLERQFRVLRVFEYISFRAVGAAVTALILTFVVGPIILRALHR